MKRYKVFNAILIAFMILCIQQSGLLTIKRFYAIVMLGNFTLLIGLLLRLPFIEKLTCAINTLFDVRDINFHMKGIKILSITTIISLITVLPLSLFLNTNFVYKILIGIVIVYAFIYGSLIYYLLACVKSFFYKAQPLKVETSTTNIISNITFNNLFINTSKTLVKKYNYNFIRFKNEIIVNEPEPKRKEKEKALLEELFKPDQIKKYLPLFKLIDIIYLNRDPEDDDVAEKWFDSIVLLTGGNKKSIRVSYSRDREKTVSKFTEILCGFLKTKGNKEILSIDSYRELSTSILKEIKLKGFRIPDERTQEFELLCVLCLSYANEKIEYPNLSNHFDIVTQKTLRQVLQNITN